MIFSITFIAARFSYLRQISIYFLFFSTTLLVYFGFIGELTGFNSVENSYAFFGFSFLSVFAAYLLKTQPLSLKSNPISLFLNLLNPIYLVSGPIPKKLFLFQYKKFVNKFTKRLSYLNRDFIIGILFVFILAPTLHKFFVLKESLYIIDIIFFGTIYEFYIYFNFAGYSLIAWSTMRLIGIKVDRNFQQPFGATNIVEYWRRWHRTLSNVLKELFYRPIKSFTNIYIATFITFFASALWHGITVNFLIWGIFHGFFWSLSRWLFLKIKRSFFINLIIFIFTVILGRVIFAESDTDFLIDKLFIIFNPYLWNYSSGIQTTFASLTFREMIHVSFIFWIIFLEIFLPKIGYKHKNYEHLKSPLISTVILLYVLLFFTGFNTPAVYGNR